MTTWLAKYVCFPTETGVPNDFSFFSSFFGKPSWSARTNIGLFLNFMFLMSSPFASRM